MNIPFLTDNSFLGSSNSLSSNSFLPKELSGTNSSMPNNLGDQFDITDGGSGFGGLFNSAQYGKYDPGSFGASGSVWDLIEKYFTPVMKSITTLLSGSNIPSPDSSNLNLDQYDIQNDDPPTSSYGGNYSSNNSYPPPSSSVNSGQSVPRSSAPPNSAPPYSAPPANGPVDENGFSTKAQNGESSPEERAAFAKRLAAHLKEKYHLTDAQVAGIMGNLMIEGRFCSNMREGAHHGDPSGFGGGPDPVRGMGIVQWTGMAQNGDSKERGRLFVEFCEKNGLDINSESANVKFLDAELESGEFQPMMDKIRHASTAEDAAQIWVSDYEKAAQPNLASRITMAHHWMDFLNGNTDAFMNDLVNF